MDLSTDYRPQSYNAFKDKYLESYFQSPTVQSHLRAVGMLTKDGRIMTDEEFKRAAVRRHQRWAARQQMAQRAVIQSRDFQLGRQLELRKQLDAVQKVETYRRLKGNSGHELIHVQPLDLERSMNRSQSAPGLRSLIRRSSAPTSAASPEQQYLQSSGYQTDDDRPKSMPHTQESGTSSRALDNSSLEDYEGHLRRQLDQIEKFRRRMQSYYSFDERLGMLPSVTAFPSASPLLADAGFRRRSVSSGTSLGFSGWNHLRFGRGSTTKRARSVSPDRNKKAVRKNLFLASAAARKRRQSQPSCECFLQFLGGKSPRPDDTSRVTITQQHSGGNNIVVFKEDLAPKAKFQFFSYRQKGFPFSLTFSDNDVMIQQSSACCESRYPVGSKLGGKNGSFKWLGVKNAVPCYKCQVHRGLQAPFTNFGQKPKKLKRKSKKTVSEEAAEEEVEKATETNDDYPETTNPAVTRASAASSGKPPRPRSARSRTSRQGSLASMAAGSVAAGGLVAMAATSGLAAIEDGDEGLHSKVHSEHGSSLNASSDEENDPERNNSSSKRSAISRKSVRESKPNDGDDFFDNPTEKVEETESARRTSSKSGGSSSSSSASSSSSSSESETESEKGDSKENDRPGSAREKTDNDDERPETSDEKVSPIEGEKKDELPADNVAPDNSGEEDVGVQANDEAEAGPGSESESQLSSSSASDSKSRKTSSAVSGKSLTQSERKLRKESVASGWGQETDEEQQQEETIKEEQEKAENEATNESAVLQNTNETESVKEPTKEIEKDIGINTGPVESDSETSSSFSSDSETENPSSKSNLDDGQRDKGGDGFAEKLKSAGSALIAEGEAISDVAAGNSETVTVDVHRTSIVGINGTDDIKSPRVDDTRSLNPWICSECKFDNDADENECRICGASKFGTTETISDAQVEKNAENENKTEGNNVESENKGENESNVEDSPAEEKSDSENEPDNGDRAAEKTDKNETLVTEPEPIQSWTCKFCASTNEGDAENCRACLLAKEFSMPKVAAGTDDDNRNSGSFSSTDNNNTPAEAGPSNLVEGDTDKNNGNEVKDGDAPQGEPVSGNDDSDSDTLADARSIDADNRLHAPDIEIQPPSPSIADANSNKMDSPRSRQNELIAEIKTIDLNRAVNYLKEFSVENFNNAGNESSSRVENNDETGDGESTSNNEENKIHAEQLDEKLAKSEVTLQGQTFSAAEVENIAIILAQNLNLNSLTIKQAKFTDADLETISNALAGNEAELRVINLNMNLLTSSSVPSILNLVRTKPVEILSLNDNKLGDEGVKQLVDGLESLQQEGRTKLLRLHIEENDIGAAAAVALGNYLKNNDRLKSLSISGSTSIGPEGWQSLAEGLKENSSLQALHLDYCHLGDENVEIVCGALKNKLELKTLDVEGNNLTEKAAGNIVDLVRTCPNLINVVALAGNTLSSETISKIQQIISGKQFPNEKDHLSLSAADFAK